MIKTGNFSSEPIGKLLQAIIILACVVTYSGFSQAREPDNNAIFFISDCQEPLFPEKLSGRYYRNVEGRDSLFADIVRQHPRTVIMLGDLIGEGSSEKEWGPINLLLLTLQNDGCLVHAIPGNHEYLLNPEKGIKNYSRAFGQQEVMGHCLIKGSTAIVLLNSIFSRLSAEDIQNQQTWYLAKMDSLDGDSTVTSIIVGTHYPPYTNSSVVGPDKNVQQKFLPRFEQSPKSRLFLAGHSHNLEYFHGKNGKKYLVIGGGGGIAQPLYSEDKRPFADQIPPEKRPLFFYIVVVQSGENLSVEVHGINKKFKELQFFLP